MILKINLNFICFFLFFRKDKASLKFIDKFNAFEVKDKCPFDLFNIKIKEYNKNIY
jgi:hypothetical protein